MHTAREIGKEHGITGAGAGVRKKDAFKKLRARVRNDPDFLIKPDIEKAFIEKYFEYYDIFADAKSTELDEAVKKELQSILDGKELKTDNVNVERSKAEEEKTDTNEELEVTTQELKSSVEEEKRRLELKDLNLSARSYNALNNSFRVLVENVGDIIDLEEEDFWKIRNLGQKSAQEIIAKIHSLGLKMKWEEDRQLPKVEENIIMSDEKSKTGISIIELNLSQRSFNCLSRAGIDNIDGVINLEEKRFRQIRNLGEKSAQEIIDEVHSLGLKMKWEKDEEEKCDTDAELESSIQQLKTAYSDLKDKEEEYEELKQQLKDSRENQKSNDENQNTVNQEAARKGKGDDGPSFEEL